MKEMICIVCPRGCHLSMDDEGNIHGNFCKRGEAYGKQEAVHPLRILTSTVTLESTSGLKRLPVMSEREIPKEMMMEVMKELRKVTVNAPIAMHQVIIENVLNLGVNIIATRAVDK